MVETHTEVTRTDVQVIGNMHRTTLIFVEALKEGLVGRVFDSAELDTLAEAMPDESDLTSPGGKHYNHLRSAILHVLKQYGLVYQRIQGTGCIKCVGANEVIEIADADRRSTHRREKRTVKKMTSVFSAASDRERTMLNQKLAVHGALVELASARVTKKLAASNRTVAVPSASKLLEALQE